MQSWRGKCPPPTELGSGKPKLYLALPKAPGSGRAKQAHTRRGTDAAGGRAGGGGGREARPPQPRTGWRIDRCVVFVFLELISQARPAASSPAPLLGGSEHVRP